MTNLDTKMYPKANFQYISKPNTKHTMMVWKARKPISQPYLRLITVLTVKSTKQQLFFKSPNLFVIYITNFTRVI